MTTTLTSYTIDRTLPTTPALAFRAFTVPEDLAAWVWGPGAKDAAAEVDPRVGGMFRVTTDGEAFGKKGGRAGMRGTFLEFVPGRRLVHTLRWDAPVGYNSPGMDPLDEAVIVELAPDPAGTRLRYTHIGIPDDGQSAREHERSNRGCLDFLEKRLVAERR